MAYRGGVNGLKTILETGLDLFHATKLYLTIAQTTTNYRKLLINKTKIQELIYLFIFWLSLR